MAKGKLPMEHLKNAEIGFDDSVNVENTQILDGGAKDSPVFNETNKTQQHTTGNIPKSDLGGRNNLNG